MALPTDLQRVAPRVFYLAGGYKYAMAGEGATGPTAAAIANAVAAAIGARVRDMPITRERVIAALAQ